MNASLPLFNVFVSDYLIPCCLIISRPTEWRSFYWFLHFHLGNSILSYMEWYTERPALLLQLGAHWLLRASSNVQYSRFPDRFSRQPTDSPHIALPKWGNCTFLIILQTPLCYCNFPLQCIMASKNDCLSKYSDFQYNNFENSCSSLVYRFYCLSLSSSYMHSLAGIGGVIIVIINYLYYALFR